MNIETISLTTFFAISAIWVLLRRIGRARKIRSHFPQLADPHTLLMDVGSPVEHLNTARDKSIHFPLDRLNHDMEKMDHDRPIAVCCEKGRKSKIAKELLEKNGFKNVTNVGPCQNAAID